MNTQAKSSPFEKFGRKFQAGEIIFREGEEGRQMYIIQNGEILISKRVRSQEKPLTTLRGGDFFGEMALLNKQPRSATATAVSDCRCLVFDDLAFETMLHSHMQVAVRMIKKLSERLRHTDAMIENLLLKDDYSRITNSLLHLLQVGNLKVKSGDKLADVAVHAGVPIRVARLYFKRLEELGMARLEGADELVSIRDQGRLERLKRYLEMREEFIVLEDPKELEAEAKSRVSFF